LEAIGVKTGGLVIDFSDSDRRYFTAVDGLNFDRIYDAHAVCEYGINEKTPLGDRKFAIISDFTEQLQFLRYSWHLLGHLHALAEGGCLLLEAETRRKRLRPNAAEIAADQYPVLIRSAPTSLPNHQRQLRY
jgi:hypothetical protein